MKTNEPKAVEIEKLVLGALLINSKIVEEAVVLLKSSDIFYETKHKIIYDAMLVMIRNNENINIVTISNKLRKLGTLNESGGDKYLVDLSMSVSGSANFENHCRIILQEWVKRTIISSSLLQIAEAETETKDVFELLEDAEKNLDNINELLTGGTNTETFSMALQKVVERVEMLTNLSGQKVSGITTGFRKIDDFTGGWQNSDLIIIAARPGMGKLQPLTEPVLTPFGWKLMGDIKKGSEVICPISGYGIKVKEVYPQDNLNIYKVIFNDNTYTECCNEHLFKIQTQTDIKNNKHRVVDVDWMLKSGVLDTRGKSRFRIPLTNAVEFEPKEVPIHPYILGLMIGNGSLPFTKNCTLTSHSDVASILYDKIKDLVSNDVNISLNKKSKDVLAQRIGFSKQMNSLFKDIGLLGCKSREKFIPDLYLYNSVEVRKQLLYGLMDSDGSCFVYSNKKRTSYSTMSVILKDNIIELIRSLGGKASASSETRDKYKNNGKCWNVYIRTPFNPFTLISKKEKFNSVGYSETFTKTITDIKYLRKDKGQCISVDSEEHLYITRDYTVTHNTSLILKNILEVAKKGDAVGVFSLEMSTQQLATRLVAIDSQFHLGQLMKHGFDRSEYFLKLLEKQGEMETLKIFIDDSAGISIYNLYMKARMWKRKYDIKILFVDYIQLMSGESKGGNREQEISMISRKLKHLAKELNIPVIALSQLSRQVEARSDKRPKLSDLRESGAIEQDADVVIFIYRPEYYDDLPSPELISTGGNTEIIFSKYRSGSLETKTLFWQGEKTKFCDPEDNFVLNNNEDPF